jgi:hypothetical protein
VSEERNKKERKEEKREKGREEREKKRGERKEERKSGRRGSWLMRSHRKVIGIPLREATIRWRVLLEPTKHLEICFDGLEDPWCFQFSQGQQS